MPPNDAVVNIANGEPGWCVFSGKPNSEPSLSIGDSIQLVAVTPQAHGAQRLAHYANNPNGFSTSPLNACINSAPSAPSIAR